MSRNLGLVLALIASLLVLVRAATATAEAAATSTSFMKTLLSPAIMTPLCYDKMLDFPPSTACITSTLSKVLGLGIIAGSFALKLPQILGIIKAGTAKGMILSALYLETSSVASTSLYNLAVGTPLSTYAESLVIFIQNIILIVLCWSYQGIPMNQRLTAAVGGIVYVVSHFAIPPAFLSLIMLLATVTSMSGRVQQIVGNFKAKSTGVLSLTTTLMQVGGTAARVFTTLQEVDDIAILSSFVVAFLLNATILAQIIIYWNQKQSITSVLATDAKKLTKDTIEAQIAQIKNQSNELSAEAVAELKRLEKLAKKVE